MRYVRAKGGSASLNWNAFNQSRAGKLFAVLVVSIAFVVAWPMLTRFQAAGTAMLPLPGSGPGDRCAIWFIGSSTIHRWDDLADDMAPWKIVKRGVDGATFPQLIERFANDPAKVPPRAIVLYAGENDLAGGARVEDIQRRLYEFLDTKNRMFGRIPVLLISLKPSPGRWSDRPEQVRYNAQVRKLVEEDLSLSYIEIGPLLMDGKRPGDHYHSDGIHLTQASYRLWAPVLKAALAQHLGTPDCVG
jgi:lysophospholipase L1-like esterase